MLNHLEGVRLSNILPVIHQPLVTSLLELVADKHIHLDTAVVAGIKLDILQVTAVALSLPAYLGR
jgi:hypothetical protein